jgi:hypothetical protein
VNDHYFDALRALIQASKGKSVVVEAELLRRCISAQDFHRLAPQCWFGDLKSPVTLSPEQAAFVLDKAEEIATRRFTWALGS